MGRFVDPDLEEPLRPEDLLATNDLLEEDQPSSVLEDLISQIVDPEEDLGEVKGALFSAESLATPEAQELMER